MNHERNNKVIGIDNKIRELRNKIENLTFIKSLLGKNRLESEIKELEAEKEEYLQEVEREREKLKEKNKESVLKLKQEREELYSLFSEKFEELSELNTSGARLELYGVIEKLKKLQKALINRVGKTAIPSDSMFNLENHGGTPKVDEFVDKVMKKNLQFEWEAEGIEIN